MKRKSNLTMLISNFANHKLFFSIFFLLLPLSPLGLAYAPAVDDPKLEELSKNFKAITSEYKAALKAKKDFVEEEMKETEESLSAEDDKENRKKLVVHLRDLKIQHEEISDKVRVITAGEVVKLSNTKDKVVAFLTHQ